MLSLALPVEIYFCTQATDMRRGFDGLLRMAEERLSRSVLHCGFPIPSMRRMPGDYRRRVMAVWFKRISRQMLPAIVEAHAKNANAAGLICGK